MRQNICQSDYNILLLRADRNYISEWEKYCTKNPFAGERVFVIIRLIKVSVIFA